MNGTHNVSAAYIQNLIAAFMALKIFEGWIGCLEHCSHCTICNDNSLGERTAKQAWCYRAFRRTHLVKVTLRLDSWRFIRFRCFAIQSWLWPFPAGMMLPKVHQVPLNICSLFGGRKMMKFCPNSLQMLNQKISTISRSTGHRFQ